MSHSSHGGMDMSIGSATNHAFARDYWYICAGVVGLGAMIRGVHCLQVWSRLKASRDASIKNPTRPDSRLSQIWATTTALIREISHPQYHITTRGLQLLAPLPLGRILLLLVYWAVIVYFMSYDVVKYDVYFWERIGYRNGWVTMAQLPMLYLLSMKINPVAYLIGSSHERMNWLHRWVARTMLITATVHGFHFWSMWVEADFLETALKITPLVKYGLGAWAILLWLTITGIIPLRRLAYEIWVAQHIIASIVMLWLLYIHIPASSRYLLWMSISFLVFDRAARWLLLAWRNLRFKPNKSSCQGQKRLGHHVSITAVGSATTLVTIKDVHFKWSAGQYIYLWLPRVGLLEAHPYTIACAHQPPSGPGMCTCNSIQLIVRAHNGFSRRLHACAVDEKHSKGMTGFISGPYGAPACWAAYDTLVLIGASTGASFTVPILESISLVKGCVRRVEFVLLARTAGEIGYYVDRSRSAAIKAREQGINVRLHIAVTKDGENTFTSPDSSLPHSGSDLEAAQTEKGHEQKCCCCDCGDKLTSHPNGGASPRMISSSALDESIHKTRPDLEALIRNPVEEAWGETAVIICGGKAVVASTRNCVSRLSDERAVHKGTGAQGIYLHVEEYAF